MTEIKRREREIAQIQLQTACVLINPTNPFTYASGMKSPMYCDNRALLSYPEARDKIVDMFLYFLAQKVQNFDVIAGVATAGIPWASMLADRLEKPLIYVRDKPKEHGRQNQIEGKFEKEQKIVIIEDHISTGESSLKAIEAVRNAGAIVEHCIAISSWEMQQAAEAFQAAACQLWTGTRFTALVEEAIASGKVSQEEHKRMMDWKEDQKSWK
jgi:orotate phosphoribosyltransferase